MRFFVTDTKPVDVVVQLVSGSAEYFIREGKQLTLVLGFGEKDKLTLRVLRLLVRKAVQSIKQKQCREVGFVLPEWQIGPFSMNEEELGEMLVVNVLLANYAFHSYKTPPKEGFSSLEKVYFFGAQNKKVFIDVIKKAQIIGEEVNRARSIANEPAGNMTPEHLVHHAKRCLEKLPIRVTVFDEKRLIKENMAGILAVGKGSEAKPRFIVAEYRQGKKTEAPIVLIGKGVTFDSGGINLKPSDAILGMNMDMSGAATALHVLSAVARLKIKKNIIVLIPAVENMISGRSYRPGDIIRTASGKTIEVQNTDAEGRIILADALHYAKRYKPGLVIDVATLTGAAMVALGERAAALFTEDEKLESTLRHIGMWVGDPVWPMPLWDEYLEDIRGIYADIGNVGTTRYGGAVTAAIFLKQFVDYPWVHLDIAPRMTATASEQLAKGSLGAGALLLIRYLTLSEHTSLKKDDR